MEEKKENKKLWITVIIVSIIVIGVCVGIFLYRGISNTSFDNALSQVKTAIKDSYAGCNSFEVSGHTVNIKIWSDGMMGIAKAAYEGNQDQIKNWNVVKDKVYILAGQIYDKFLLVDDIVVYLRYVNDQNPDRDLLVYKNKELVYDVVNEAKGD